MNRHEDATVKNPLESESARWTLVTTASTVLAAVLVRKAMQRGWTLWRGAEPPQNPVDPEVDWLDALAWAGATGAAVALARVLARRGAAEGWRVVTGRFPPV